MRLTALFATRFPSEINPSSSSSSTSEPNKINDEVNQFNCYYSKLILYTYIFKILFDYLREDFIEFYFVRKDIFTKSILNYLQKDFDSKLDYPLSTILNTSESQSLKVNLTILFLLF